MAVHSVLNTSIILRLIIKSFNSQIISLFLHKRLSPLIKSLGLVSLESVPLPSKRKTFTFNKSPHVFSKSKEQYELVEFSRLLFFKPGKNSDICLLRFETILKKNIPVGLSIKILK